MNKLRLSFLLSIGGSVAVGDQFHVTDFTHTVNSCNVGFLNAGNPYKNERLIISFAKRGANNPHCYDSDLMIDTGTAILPASKVDWDLIVAWKYDLESLVKAQDKHDLALIADKTVKMYTEKTVLDVVNVYEADLDLSEGMCVIYMHDRYQIVDLGDWMECLVCSEKEFNQCVDDLSNHYGDKALFKFYEANPKIPLTKENSDYSYYEDKASQNLLNAVVESGRSAAQLKEAMNMQKLTSNDIDWSKGSNYAVVSMQDNAIRKSFMFEPTKIKMGCGSDGYNFKGNKFNAEYYYIVEREAEQLVYTPEIKLTHKQPEVDMLARIEFDCADMGLMVVDFTLKFETSLEYAGLDKDGFCMVVKKHEFIAWHTINDKSPLEVAKLKQVDDICTLFIDNGYVVGVDAITLLQNESKLAAIVI